MLTLNRKSAVYQELFNNAMTRLNRVPKELLEPLTEPNPKLAATLAPYVFEREELEYKMSRPGQKSDRTIDFGDYFGPRITQNQAIAFGRHHATYFQMPTKCYFGGETLASLMWIVFASSAGTFPSFDLRSAAHRAVSVYIANFVRQLNTDRTRTSDTEGDFYFTHRSTIDRRNAMVAKILNQDDLSILERLFETIPSSDLTDGDCPNAITVRFPIQLTGPGLRDGQPFYQFPYSFIDYRDAIDNVLHEIFSIHETTGAGEADRALVSRMKEEVGTPSSIIGKVRNVCFTHWLQAEQISPKICRELAENLLANYRGYFAAAFRVENDALLNSLP